MAVVNKKKVANTTETSKGEDISLKMDPKEENENTTDSNSKQKQQKEKKYIVFVGNLPYTAGEEEIKNHFKAVKNQIMKVDIHHYPDGRSRGCCFIELKNKEAYQKAFKMNKSKFEGRSIRIEYTVPGGNSQRRKNHIQKKTKKILGQKKAKKGKGKMKEIPDKVKKSKTL